MCECLDEAETCECCGAQVEMQEFEGEPSLMHFVDHEKSEDGELVHSLWERHDHESCLAMRREHWMLLVRSGIAVEAV